MPETKVLILASTFPRRQNDSTPPFVYELSKQFVDKANVIVLVPHSRGAKKQEVLAGMEIHRFSYWPFSKKLADGAILPNLKTNKLFWLQVPFFFLFELIALLKMLKEYKPDVIHAHWIIPQGIVTVVAKKLSSWNGRIVCTTHGGDIFGLQFLNGIKKKVLNNCANLTVVSEAIKRKIQEIGITKIPIEVIPMGVDTEKFNPDKKDLSIKKKYNIKNEFLLFVGRLSEKKGIEYLIKAIPIVLKKFPDTKLLIVGEGELEKRLKNIAFNELRLKDKVAFAGGLSNTELPRYYATADVFIGPSIIAENGDREGFPVSFMETMACGTPLITSDIEIFKPLIQYKNALKAIEKSPADIASCIIKLLSDNELKNEIIKNNFALIESQYSLKVVGANYFKILS